MSRVVVIIQARLGSTRLPRKVLADICGKPMIEHVVERARMIRGSASVWVAVPWSESGEWRGRCLPWCAFSGIDDADVLLRYWQAAQTHQADIVVRITGDCPLTSPDVCERVLRLVVEDGIRFATNDTRSSGYPDGTDVECFTRELLEEAHAVATDPQDREHVTRWMYRNVTGQAMLTTPGSDWPKLSVDTQDDLDFVRRIMARIPAGDYSWKATQEAISADLSEKS